MGFNRNTTTMTNELAQLESHTKRVLIVDDEPDARSVIASYLLGYFPQHRTVGQAGSVGEAFRLIRETRPDLIFLDVEMADGTGFDLLDKFPRSDFQVIFTTAHDEFALRAFKYSAVDYLLKPIAPEDFTRAVDKAASRQSSRMQHLLKMVSAPRHALAFEKIALPSQEGITMMALGDIVRLQSDGGYTTFWDKNGERCLVSRSIGEFEELLPSTQFMRIHTSHLVNLDCVKKFIREDGGTALMLDGSQVPIARRRKERFLEILRGRSVF